MLVAALWRCMWGRDREGAMAPGPLSAGLQSLPPLPTIKLLPSGVDSRMGGLAHTLGPCGSLQRTLLWGWEFLLMPQSPQVFFQSEVLRLYYPALEFWVVWSVSLPSCSSWFIYTQMWDYPLYQLPPYSVSSPRWLPVSVPSISMGECFFFNSLIVRLPCSLIFWLFFVFKFVVVLLVMRGGKGYLPMTASILAGSLIISEYNSKR